MTYAEGDPGHIDVHESIRLLFMAAGLDPDLIPAEATLGATTHIEDHNKIAEALAWLDANGVLGGDATVSATTGSPTLTTAADKDRYKWTANGSFTLDSDGYVEYLVAGGGGTGQTAFNPSGGGQVSTGYLKLTAGTYAVTVGAKDAAGTAGGRAGMSSIGTLALAPGGQNAISGHGGRSAYNGDWSSGGAGGAGGAASGATGGPGIASTIADGSTSVEYGKGGSWSANVASPANTGKGGDAAAGTSQYGADGVVIIAVRA